MEEAVQDSMLVMNVASVRPDFLLPRKLGLVLEFQIQLVKWDQRILRKVERVPRGS